MAKKGNIHVTCSQCGNDTLVTGYAFARNKTGNFFCNIHCKSLFFVGNKNPAFNSIEKKCDYCGTLISVSGFEAKKYKHNFCNLRCRDLFFEKKFVDVACNFCGKPKTINSSDYNANKNYFCDLTCYVAWRKKNSSNRNNADVGKIEVFCANCGTKKLVYKSVIIRHSLHFCNKKCKGIWMSNNIIGSKSPLWMGGKTEKQKLIRGNSKMSAWRNSIFERDNYTCQFCGKHGGKLNAHHIVPVSIDCNKIYNINNGITLCVVCHKRAHRIGTIENRIFIGYRLKYASTDRIDKDYYQCINDVFDSIINGEYIMN